MSSAAQDALKEVREANTAQDRLVAAYKAMLAENQSMREQITALQEQVESGEVVDAESLAEIARSAQEIEDEVNELLGPDPANPDFPSSGH